MPYTGNPATSAIDRMRLTVGDIFTDMEYLQDDVYDYLLDKYTTNEGKAALEAARYILALLARNARERAGEIEVYGREFFQNYKEFLVLIITDVNFSTVTYNAIPFAGGISKNDMLQSDLDPDMVRHKVYAGFSTGVPDYRKCNTLYRDPFNFLPYYPYIG